MSIKKLSLSSRIANHVSFDTIINPETGEVLVEKDEVISREVAREIQNAGINVDINDIRYYFRFLFVRES